ncbi:hypothetical protein TNCV_3215761 [Trichonephila clavipes]|nr:hypothetical protein TNCV_3215761 [Trichonephila clavipes]
MQIPLNARYSISEDSAHSEHYPVEICLRNCHLSESSQNVLGVSISGQRSIPSQRLQHIKQSS